MKNIILPIFLALGILVTESIAQSCPDVKRMCLSSDSKVWHYNVQSKSGAFEAGSTYEMSFVAYKGMDYRLSVCSDNEESDGKIEFEVYELVTKKYTEEGVTKYKKVPNYLIKNKEHDMTPMVEFNSTKTRKMYLKVRVPNAPSGESKSKVQELPMVCVGVLIEQKSGVKTGFN